MLKSRRIIALANLFYVFSLVGLGGLGASLMFAPQQAQAQSLPVTAFHVHIELVLPGKPYESDWQNLCKLLAKSMAPGSGPWGFGIFRSATCFLGSKVTAGVAQKDSWLLQVSSQNNETRLSLFPPAPAKSKDEQVTLGPQSQLVFPASTDLAAALKSSTFVQLAGAYLLDGLPFVSQITAANLKKFETIEPLPAASLLPPQPEQIEYLDLRADALTGDVRVKVLKKSDIRTLLKSGNVWAGNKAGSQTLQNDLMARIKAELVRRQKIPEAAARKKRDEEKKKQEEARALQEAALKQAETEQAERDNLQEVDDEEEDEGPPIPLSFGSEIYGGFWPAAFLGSGAQKINGGFQFDAAQGVTNRFSLGADYQAWKKDVSQLSSMRGWAGWTLGVEGISFINALELGQALGASLIQFKTDSILKPGTKVSVQQPLFPLYHVEVGIIVVQENLRYKPFVGYDTALGGASELNIISAGLDVGYAFSSRPLNKDRTLVSSAYGKYIYQQTFFRDVKLVKAALGEVFDNVRTSSLNMGVRFSW